MSDDVKLSDMERRSSEVLLHLDNGHLMPLPAPLDEATERAWKPLADQAREKYECSLDDTIALSIPKPANEEAERALVRQFLAGLDKLFTRENNWTFLQPLLLTMEHCARCQTCAEACHIFEASGRQELYR
ncbi:MAG: hypothetical protein ACM3NQ_15745, partial [Bacteroidales bacterium]